MRHVSIKPRSPNLNGGFETSQSTDGLGFYQLPGCYDDVHLGDTLAVWEEFYDAHRPRPGLGGRTPTRF